MKRTKNLRLLIKEELIALTGGYYSAVILQQFLYWSQRCKDKDHFWQEEIDRAQSDDPTAGPTNAGWIYKSRQDLHHELRLSGSMNVRTLGDYLKRLVETGYLLRRNNPTDARDQTWQYRLDLVKLIADLIPLGFELQGYAEATVTKIATALTKPAPAGSKDDTQEVAGQPPEGSESATDLLNICPEITPEIKAEIADARLVFDPDNSHLKAIQRLLACSRQHKRVRKYRLKDQWLKIQAKIAADSSYWFFCEELAKDYDIGKRGIEHWMALVLDEQRYLAWAGDCRLDPGSSTEGTDLTGGDPSPPPDASDSGRRFHPATIPGRIAATSTLEQGVTYQNLREWGFSDQTIAALKPAPADDWYATPPNPGRPLCPGRQTGTCA